MKKITIDCRMIEHSGLGRYLQNIVPRLLRISSDNFYYLIGPRDKIEKYIIKESSNYKIINCKLPIFSLKEQLLMIFYIPNDTDLLWVPHFNVPFFYRGKMIVTIHDMLQYAYPQFSGGLIKKIAAKIYFRIAAYKANKIITVSNFSKSEIKRYLELEDNVYVIYNGIDEEWFHVHKDVNFQHYGHDYFLYVGNVKKHKNIKIFLQAMYEVRKKINVRAIVVGKKEGLRTPDDNLEKYVDLLGDGVEFTGFVTEYELKQYYANAKAFIFPSLYEGFGFPVLEAMACGCPVISSNAASLPEIGNKFALYFSPNNKNELIKNIYNVQENCYPIDIYEGKKFARKYSWADSVMRLKMIIDGMF